RRDHIDEGACGIGYGNFNGTTPECFQSENALGIYVLQLESCPLRRYSLLGNTACGKDESLIKELLGEFPMVGGRPSADVGLTEECGNEYPGICNYLVDAGEIQRYRNVEPVPNPSEPALLSPP